MPQRGGAPDQDFEYRWSDPDDTGASYGRDPVTEPIPVAEVQNLVPDQPDDYSWDDHDEVPAGSVEIPPEPVDVYDLVPEQPTHRGERCAAAPASATSSSTPAGA